jgi:hypothetical protein
MDVVSSDRFLIKIFEFLNSRIFLGVTGVPSAALGAASPATTLVFALILTGDFSSLVLSSSNWGAELALGAHFVFPMPAKEKD